MNLLRPAIDLGRGAMIGTVEIIPGVSGGTLALILGVYDDLIDSAGSLARGVVRGGIDLVRGQGTARARAHFRDVRWNVVLPVGIGMLIAIVLASALLGPLIEDHPVETRAVFAGLIVASIVVPARMVGGRWTAQDFTVAALGAAAAFLLTSLPPLDAAERPLVLVALAAAVAVCALVLPGVSGSFILLTVGMYESTLAAVNDRDLTYLGVFVLGAIVGLGLFVSGLQWLLEHRRRVTLAVMTGLMAGSLRALWPWQTDEGAMEAPEGNVLGVVLLFLAGIVVVALMLVVESALVRKRLATGEDVLDPETAPHPDDDPHPTGTPHPTDAPQQADGHRGENGPGADAHR